MVFDSKFHEEFKNSTLDFPKLSLDLQKGQNLENPSIFTGIYVHDIVYLLAIVLEPPDSHLTMSNSLTAQGQRRTRDIHQGWLPRIFNASIFVHVATPTHVQDSRCVTNK